VFPLQARAQAETCTNEMPSINPFPLKTAL
jgi:hypothetical protein